MDDIRSLYQTMILDHGRSPRNFKQLEQSTHQQEGHNPICGDQLTVFVQVSDDKVIDVAFQGDGCAISMASASMMTEVLKGKSLLEAKVLFELFRRLVMGQSLSSEEEDQLGKLMVLAGVQQYPMRGKCATLAWHTLDAALDNDDHAITTTENVDDGS